MLRDFVFSAIEDGDAISPVCQGIAIHTKLFEGQTKATRVARYNSPVHRAGTL